MCSTRYTKEERRSSSGRPIILIKRHCIERSKLNLYKQNKGGIAKLCDSLAELLEAYVELYGWTHWYYSTYTSHVALIQNHILPAFGDMKLTEFSPKTIASLYSKIRNLRKMTPQILSSVHKLLHSAFEQAVLWKYTDRNPFHKATLPKLFPCPMEMLSNE